LTSVPAIAKIETELRFRFNSMRVCVKPPSPELHWIRTPRQARTQQSLERLLDAAQSLLRHKRFEDVHVADVAERAGTSVGGLYRRFKDKDGLLHALHERLVEEAFATAADVLDRDRWQGAGIAEILFTIFPFLIEVLQRHENLDRAIYQRALTDDLMRERSSRLLRYVVAGLGDLLVERSDEIRHPEPEVAVPFGLLQSVAFLVHHYTAAFREIEPVPLGDERIAQELATNCLAYLGVRDPYAPFGGEQE
jgi:AcrR family transcriptional regulator